MMQSLGSRESELDQARIHVIALQRAIGIEQSHRAVKFCWCFLGGQYEVNTRARERDRFRSRDDSDISERIKIGISEWTAR